MKISACYFLKNRAINALLSAAFTAMALCFSGCFEPIEIDLGNTGFLHDGGPGGSYSPIPDGMSVDLAIDTAINIETNSVTLIVNVRPFNMMPEHYPSIVVLNGTRVTIERTDSLMRESSVRKFMTGPDTVDFETKYSYQFQLKIDSLSSGAEYQFHVQRAYSTLQRSDSAYCVLGMPNYGCEYKVQTKN